MPQFVNETSKDLSYLSVDNFRITSNLVSPCDIIEENIKHYRHILFPPLIQINSNLNSSDKMLVELRIELSSQECPLYPNSTMDESCNKSLIFLKTDGLSFSLYFINCRRFKNFEWLGHFESKLCMGRSKRIR
jgi:hypothetical protein